MLRARRAVRAQRLEAALALLADPLVRDDRRAVDLRRQVLREMLRRAEERIRTGHLTLAEQDLARLATLDPDLPGRAEVLAEIAEQRAASHERREQEEQLRRGFERALDEGRLNDAREFLKGLGERVEPAAFAVLEERLKERRLAASKALHQVREALDRGLEREARDAMDRARRLCADSLAFRERLVGLSAAWAKDRWNEIQAALTSGRTLDAARALADWWESDPDSEDVAEARDLLLCVADRLAADARDLAQKGRFPEALQLVCLAPSVVAHVNVLRRLKERLEQLDALLGGEDDDPRRRVQGLTRLHAETRWPVLETHLGELRAAARDLDAGLGEARDMLARGETAAGKDKLDSILTRWPGCDEARALRDGLLDDERERQEQLKAAREAVRNGRLLEAQRHLFRLVTGGVGAEEARNLLRDVERVRSKVSREATALATRLAAGVDPEPALAQIARLRQLQQDSPELQDLEALALRRKRGREREAAVRAAVRRRDAAACLHILREWVEESGDGGFSAEERGRLEAMGSEIETVLRAELTRGAPAFVCALGCGLRSWQAMLGVDLEPLLAEASGRIDRARAVAQEGLDHLRDKREEAAARSLEAARDLAHDDPDVLRLAHRLRSVERDRTELERALELAATDREGAKEKLASLGPTPRPLGSLVLQVRDKVERSGDLEAGCLLEVEEAGEFLLFTDDRLRVGNATGRSFPQLPILARIKAHHATFVRAVSFHGGVSDRVEAVEGAEVKVNGGAPEGALKHGDRIALAGTLSFLYLRPNPRSVSALLRIERGFDCRGTQRILWLKQGGRDGRVLIGRGREMHVRVPHTEPELSLYAPGRGRLCVSFKGVGQIDGVDFTGDRELASGAQVVCGKIRFRVLPL